MARNSTVQVYSGKLVLDKITGIRADRLKGATPIQELVKPDTSFKARTNAMKTVANVTQRRS